MAFPSALKAVSDPNAALCEYLDELVERLHQLVPAALKEFDAKSIHQSRVATRRMKAAIELLEPVLSGEHRKPLAKAGKKLRRRLGPMRDLDVMIEHLEKIQRREAHREAAKWLAERLSAAREQAREESKSDETPGQVLARLGSWWALREEILAAGEQTQVLLTTALHAQLEAFAEQARKLGDREATDRQDPHAVRIAGKALRYTLEMARKQGRPVPPLVAKAFKQMQDLLGGWHDFVVLAERAMSESIEALLAHHDTELQQRVLDLARWSVQNARKDLEKFSALWAKQGSDLIEAIRRAAPLPAGHSAMSGHSAPSGHSGPAVSEPQTDRDPRGSDESAAPADAAATDPEAA
jgi:CHAD domain-containing protein